MPSLTFFPLQPEHVEAVRRLILGYLAERWGELDPDLNTDLQDPCATYAEGHFLTVWSEETLVGTGALIPEAPGTARIVRMAVARAWRGQGIGRLIVQRLLREAQKRGDRRIVLETEAAWTDAVAFYTRCGFLLLGIRDGEAHFEMVLPGEERRSERAERT